MPQSPFAGRTPRGRTRVRPTSATVVLGVVCAFMIAAPARAADLQATPSNFSSVFNAYRKAGPCDQKLDL